MSNKVEITRAFFKQALREGDFRLAASDMNYENNRNPKDTNLSSAEITPIMVSRVSREKSRQLKRRFATAIIGKRQIIMRLDTRLLQPFASWSNSL